MREEQEIFDDLGQICTSPGYVHAIAYLCFRDNVVPYSAEMTAQDVQHLFSKTRLIRSEISTLIGLLVKEDVSYALPSPADIQSYITETENLLEELHRAMLGGMFTACDLKDSAHKHADDRFSRGAVLREPIFYSGESAYYFQYRDLSPRKYAADNGWLEANKGFSIEAARDIVDALGTLQAEKLGDLVHALQRSHPDEWTLLPGFCFTLDELARAAEMDISIAESVLSAFTLPESEKNQGFNALHDFNAANATPVLRADTDAFVLFQPYTLAEALYESPFYWMISDKNYASAAMRHRGRFTEEFAKERLELVFGKDQVYSNVDVYEHEHTRVGEIDVLVIFGDRAIVLQAKSKRLTLEARRGNDNQIKDDFKKSVQESYDQGFQCSRFLTDPELKFVDATARVLTVPKLNEIYILCVVSDHYPALSFQARQFLKLAHSDPIRPPFVMDIFALDTMTEMLASPLQTLSYVDRRTKYSDRLMASHELVILAYHLKKNLWLDQKYNLVILEDDISADLDVAMAVRRDNIPGKRTPDGILTRVAETALGRLAREIEARPEPGVIDFGFMLLTLSEDAVLGISRATEAVAGRARKDGKNHDLTVRLSEANAGLTVHCNDDPMPIARSRLEKHCAARKYTEKASKWYGICVLPADISLRFGITLNYPWQPSSQMEAATRDLRKPETRTNGLEVEPKRKIGRNDPCPCGSGLKYKKCCLN